MSIEVDILEELPGFSIDGADLETSALPDGWRDRLVKVQNANTTTSRGSTSGPAASCLSNRRDAAGTSSPY